jgi:hypothetical protein
MNTFNNPTEDPDGSTHLEHWVYQPTLLGRREDIDPEECTVSQLKFKASTEEDADR